MPADMWLSWRMRGPLWSSFGPALPPLGRDARRLSAASPINAQLVWESNHCSSRQPSGDSPNNPTAWEGTESDFPLSLLISYSYVIADVDQMGVWEDLHHCHSCVCGDCYERVPRPARIWHVYVVFYATLFKFNAQYAKIYPCKSGLVGLNDAF